MELARLFDVNYENVNSNSRNLQRKDSRGGEGLNYIQKRLQEFNSRLTGIIHSENNEFIGSNSNVAGQSRISNRSEGNNIEALKEKLNNLQKYCASLEVQLGNNEKIEPNPGSADFIVRQEKEFKQEVDFYKNKS